MQRILALWMSDMKNILRDSILLIGLIGPILFSLLVKFGLPSLEDFLFDQYNWELVPHYPFILSIVLLMTPLTVGMLMGFMLLEDRDENMLLYYSVTPLTKSGYLLYKTASIMMVTFLVSFMVIYLCNLLDIELVWLLPINLLISLETPIIALFIASFASNKVEGLALSKVTSVLLIVPFAVYFMDSSWVYVAGLLPPYWITFSMLRIGTSDFWMLIVGGLLVHLIYLGVLNRIFQRKIE
ncbi:hypothetical protein ACFSCX_15715 [Bacillus salitolerans]|uniref:ABC transporter permease n=1 Tax=Bacillus salitolerans TaxID=1437434 RepID=A0ABW4LS59_9BACI